VHLINEGFGDFILHFQICITHMIVVDDRVASEDILIVFVSCINQPKDPI
jgi:hypothetical protein